MNLHKCPSGHISSVTRLPNKEGVRRCFFCPEVARPIVLVEPLVGYEACWKTVEGKPGNCRKPIGHDGECSPF